MRVAVLASHFADYSVELASALSAENQVLLLADPVKLDAECSPEQIAEVANVASLHPLRQGRFLSRWRGACDAALALASFRPQLTIAHEHPHPHVTWLQRTATHFGPLALIVHDPQPHTGRDAEFAQKRARQIAAQRSHATRLFAHGEYCARALSSVLPGAKLVTAIPHGPILRPEAPPKAPPGGSRMLMFGRMEAYKGLDTLLEACRLLAAKNEPIALEIIGGGPELDRLQREFASLDGVAISNAYASRGDLIAAMARADLVVAPYNEATQSGVLAAAFSNGRPVLASAVGGLPDFLSDGMNGRLVAPRSPALLAEAIARWSEESRGSTALWRGALTTSETTMAWRAVADALTTAI